jgi:ATP-dependent DNA helicase RecQ
MDIYWKKGGGSFHIGCWDNSKNGESDNLTNTPNYYRESEIAIPKILRAREKYQGYQVRFYESLAIPEEMMNAVCDNDISAEKLRGYNQWRIDFPDTSVSDIDDKTKLVLIVAHKILTRGKITLISPFLEDKLRKHFDIKEFNLDSFNPENYLVVYKQKKETNVWVDGEGSEKKFIEEILFNLLGPYYRHSVIPQVHISSLVDEIQDENFAGEQRVDFLITTQNNKIVVELDEKDHAGKKSHLGHEDRDLARDNLLQRWGYVVLRISNSEIEAGNGIKLDELKNLLENEKPKIDDNITESVKYVIATKIAHQIQVTVLEALLTGFLNFNNRTFVHFDPNSICLPTSDVEFVLNESVTDLNNLLQKLSKLYDCEGYVKNLVPSVPLVASKNQGIVISYGETHLSSLPHFFIQDISFPAQISQFGRPVHPSCIPNSSKQELEFFLKYIFRKESFWEGQYETIARTLSGKDTIVLLPTGGGKSIAFQLASMILPGVAVVIDPIISLIEDQIDNLRRAGIDRAIGITSQIEDPNTKSKIIAAFGQGEYLFCYVAPERFQKEDFRGSLRSLTMSTPISLIAIDEAHCVSEWGHDFRPSYLNIGRTTRDHCLSYNQIPPLLALTGTASHSVLKDVQRELQIGDFDAIITPKTFDRQELKYSVYEAPSNQKQNQLQTLLLRTLPDKFGTTVSNFFQSRENKTFSGLVFCPFVNGDFGVFNVTQELIRVGIPAMFYSGGVPKSWTKNTNSTDKSYHQYKREAAKAFKNNKTPLLVATKAFGMGIDKPNIRYTIHFGMPPSIESFYQEAGRAGRDRKKTECVLLFSVFDKDRVERVLRSDTLIEDIAEEHQAARQNGTDDDITRVLFFHTEAFVGVEDELSLIDILTKKLGNINERRTMRTVFGSEDTKVWEKAIHRLVVLGVIEDYTIDYSSKEFNITLRGIDKEGIIRCYELYVAGYNKVRIKEESQKLQAYNDKPYNVFVREACRILIDFIYDTIERGRRRSLREMFLLADSAVGKKNCDEIIRKRILRYLESSRAEEIESIVNDDNVFDKLQTVIQGYETPEGEMVYGIRSPHDAAEMRGQSARYLESTPDHPGLLFLRAVSEAYCPDYKFEVIVENLKAGVGFAFNRYGRDKETIYKTLSWILINISERKRDICRKLVEELIYVIDDPAFAQHILKNENFSDDMLYPPGIYLFNRLAKEVIETIKTG